MLTRKQFLRSALGPGAATLGLTVLAGCDTTAPGPDATGGSASCLQNGTRVMIGANHGHVLVVTKPEQLCDNHASMVTSSFEPEHSHDIMIACA